MDDLFNMVSPHTGKRQPMISEFHHDIIMKYAEQINSTIIYERDFEYNYFGFKVNFLITYSSL